MDLSSWIDDLKSKFKGVQLLKEELTLIIENIVKIKGCKFLVFGLGNDTGMWMEINRDGRTAFIEDQKGWFDKITTIYPESEAYLINYPYNITQWKELLDKPRKLKLHMPEEITKTKWDIILVDGPAGWQMIEEFAGRMSSIYMAKKLIKKGGIIFIHDCEREVEETYANKYLKEDKFVQSVYGLNLLKMYKG